MLFQNICSVGTNWEPDLPLVGGGTATCTVAGVEVPDNPVPETFRIGGMITATDGVNPDLDVTKEAQSDAVDVNVAAISATKRVVQIQRGVAIVYPQVPAIPLPPVAAGDVVTYEITVTNTGDVPVDQLSVEDSLEGLQILDDTTLGIDPPDDTITLQVEHIITAASQDPLVNQVTARAKSTIPPGNTVTAQASAIVDIINSALEVELVVEDAVGNPDHVGSIRPRRSDTT